MKIMITGSNGLLGQKLVSALQHDPEVELIATSRGPDRTPNYLLPFSADGSGVMPSKGHKYFSLDITDREQVDRFIGEEKPDVIIHTAAMTNVDACELDPEACTLQNVTATENLVHAAKRQQIHFIHLSTDFIFDGRNGPYKENDEPAPLSIYGNSKLASERSVMDAGLERWAIARTIIVYGIAPGLSRSNVVLWAKNALEKGQPIKVVDDQWRMPTLAEDLADGCIRIAKQGATGIYHLSGPDGMSILELVQRVGRFFDLDVSVVTPIKSDSLGQPAKRPPRTGFILDKAKKELGYHPHHFEEGLAILRAQLQHVEG
jgi:dTDP-4-dehydrorhamnose reductase